MTRRFPTRDDVLCAASSHPAGTRHPRSDQVMAGPPDGEDPRERVVDPIVTQGADCGRDAVVSAEPSASAVRDGGHRVLVRDRVGRSRGSPLPDLTRSPP